MYYTGITTIDVKDRTAKHNTKGYGQHRFTAKTSDWEEFLIIPCENYLQAIAVEKHIKKMKSKKYIENLKKYPEILETLFEKLNSNRLPR